MPLLTTKEAASRLCLSYSLLTKFRINGGGPRYLKFGKSVRYSEEDLADWARARTYSHTAEYIH
jgi:excisionase family DNA binding protein